MRRPNRILEAVAGLRGVVRTQSPSLEQTTGRNPKWFIRPFVEEVKPGAVRVIQRVQKRIYLGDVATTNKRQALAHRAEALSVINQSFHVSQAQIPFGEFLSEFERDFVDAPGRLKATTQQKYTSLLRNHVRPALADRKMIEIDSRFLEEWLREKEQAGMSWHSRADLRSLMSCIFRQAIRWGFWREANPAQFASIGRKTTVRTPRKLTDEETMKLLTALPDQVRLIVETALYCTLRISEVMGLQWRHIDLTKGVLTVEQRYFRGDVDSTKSGASARTVPLGEYLAAKLRSVGPGEPGDWVFTVPTHGGSRATRDDRTIRRYFLRPAAKALGLDYPGFGFHTFRREAITRLAAHMSPMQLARVAGHSKVDMSLHYTMADGDAHAAAVAAVQERLAPGNGVRQPSDSPDRMAILSDLAKLLSTLPADRLRQLTSEIKRSQEEK